MLLSPEHPLPAALPAPSPPSWDSTYPERDRPRNPCSALYTNRTSSPADSLSSNTSTPCLPDTYIYSCLHGSGTPRERIPLLPLSFQVQAFFSFPDQSLAQSIQSLALPSQL